MPVLAILQTEEETRRLLEGGGGQLLSANTGGK